MALINGLLTLRTIGSDRLRPVGAPYGTPSVRLLPVPVRTGRGWGRFGCLGAPLGRKINKKLLASVG